MARTSVLMPVRLVIPIMSRAMAVAPAAASAQVDLLLSSTEISLIGWSVVGVRRTSFDFAPDVDRGFRISRSQWTIQLPVRLTWPLSLVTPEVLGWSVRLTIYSPCRTSEAITGRTRVWLQRRRNKLMGCSYAAVDRIKKQRHWPKAHRRLLSSELARIAWCKLDHKDRIHWCIQSTHQLPPIAQECWHDCVLP